MLRLRRERRRSRRLDWYPIKKYLHFDAPLSKKDASALVTDPKAVCAHSFLPLISFDKRYRRYRRSKSGAIVGEPKNRTLAYCSNRDACIFSYYASILNEQYEDYIRNAGIDDVVIGYRKIGSNVDLALAAFDEIRSRGSCVAFAFDISHFFDNIDHGVLKRNWCKVINQPYLPEDHYTVFRRLTKFSTVNRQACLRRLGENPRSRDGNIKRRPLCSIQEFREKIRGDTGMFSNLVREWKKEYRIPQGTPISALAANIAMIDFDVAMRRRIVALGGSYRRYSDDILILIPKLHRSRVVDLVDEELKFRTRRLRVNSKKTEEVEFTKGSLAGGPGSRWLQYLGLIFDGRRSLLRSSTIAKFYRRMHRVVAAAKRDQKKAADGKIFGRQTLHRRKIMATVSHLGSDSFVATYAATAGATLKSPGVRRQLAKHPRKLRELMNRP